MSESSTQSPIELEGTHEHTLDAKGRISIPAEFRALVGLEEGCEIVLTRPLKDACLMVFWGDAWVDYKRRIESLPTPVAKTMRRVVRGMARRVKMDRLGRIQVPQELRQYASLESKCFVMGQARYIEIWSAPIWNAQTAPENYADIDLDEFDI